ncbi:MAG: ComF family protein [Prevotellaceae bacterium]|jgi:ComF family protein|nr:ComF family protein [Prevotellaceae bacterium]
MNIKRFFTEFLYLIFPNCCFVCGEGLLLGEQYVCTQCISNIPRTGFHLQKDNPAEKRFWGKADVFRATAFFRYEKGSAFRTLVYNLKYKGHKELGEILGRFAASDLLQSNDFASVNCIVPVPLHPNKLRQRGYNQSEFIARGLAAVMCKDIDIQNLARLIENPTQTKKSVYERFQNTEGIFGVKNPQLFENKHIMLVDDVMTTGSTIEGCILAMKNVKNIKISVFTLAIA